jgi:hypothetical protein
MCNMVNGISVKCQCDILQIYSSAQFQNRRKCNLKLGGGETLSQQCLKYVIMF